MFPGGTAERLLAGAPCPVAIAPHGYARKRDAASLVGAGSTAPPRHGPRSICHPARTLGAGAAPHPERAPGAPAGHVSRGGRAAARLGQRRAARQLRQQLGEVEAAVRADGLDVTGALLDGDSAGRAGEGLGPSRPAGSRLARLRPAGGGGARQRVERAGAHGGLPRACRAALGQGTATGRMRVRRARNGPTAPLDAGRGSPTISGMATALITCTTPRSMTPARAAAWLEQQADSLRDAGSVAEVTLRELRPSGGHPFGCCAPRSTPTSRPTGSRCSAGSCAVFASSGWSRRSASTSGEPWSRLLARSS